MYLGPRLQRYGIGYANVFYNGTHPQLAKAMAACPAISSLLVPIELWGAVRRELHFDYAHNMKGKSGKYVIAYREIQKWLHSQQQAKTKPPSIEVTHHA